MSDCCSPSCQTDAPRKRKCPASGVEGVEVSMTTILHHVKSPWTWQARQQGYYFCADPECDVVYFGEDGSTITKSELRTTVGVKEASADAPLCYCFGISTRDALSDPALREFVVQSTRQGRCSCDTHNPSGRCCLKDFPR